MKQFNQLLNILDPQARAEYLTQIRAEHTINARQQRSKQQHNKLVMRYDVDRAASFDLFSAPYDSTSPNELIRDLGRVSRAAIKNADEAIMPQQKAIEMAAAIDNSAMPLRSTTQAIAMALNAEINERRRMKFWLGHHEALAEPLPFPRSPLRDRLAAHKHGKTLSWFNRGWRMDHRNDHETPLQPVNARPVADVSGTGVSASDPLITDKTGVDVERLHAQWKSNSNDSSRMPQLTLPSDWSLVVADNRLIGFDDKFTTWAEYRGTSTKWQCDIYRAAWMHRGVGKHKEVTGWIAVYFGEDDNNEGLIAVARHEKGANDACKKARRWWTLLQAKELTQFTNLMSKGKQPDPLDFFTMPIAAMQAQANGVDTDNGNDADPAPVQGDDEPLYKPALPVGNMLTVKRETAWRQLVAAWTGGVPERHQDRRATRRDELAAQTTRLSNITANYDSYACFYFQAGASRRGRARHARRMLQAAQIVERTQAIDLRTGAAVEDDAEQEAVA